MASLNLEAMVGSLPSPPRSASPDPLSAANAALAEELASQKLINLQQRQEMAVMMAQNKLLQEQQQQTQLQLNEVLGILRELKLQVNSQVHALNPRWKRRVPQRGRGP